MKNAITRSILRGIVKDSIRLFFSTACALMLLMHHGNVVAQTTNPTTQQLIQLRQANSFNKQVNALQKGNQVNLTNFAVQQADAVTNPLLQIIQSLVGPGITVSNIQTTLPATSNIYGSFTGGTNVIGIESGLVMTSGSVFNILGPNISPSTSQDNGLPGYLTLDTAGYDAAVISFDVTSATPYLTFKYVFASEEYNEYVGSQFNDDFAFFISGPGIPAGTNIALIPGTNHAVDINDINMGVNSQYYVNNDSAQNADPFRFQNLEYDGLTKVLVTTAITVVPGSVYTITLVVQDVSDHVYDSGVFIQGGSITGDSCTITLSAQRQDAGCNGNNNGSIDLTVIDATGAVTFAWSNGATTEDISNLAPGTYNVTVTDSKGCTATLNPPVVINESSLFTIDEIQITPDSCAIGNDGEAEIEATGGTPPYIYTLNGMSNNTGIFTGLPAGNFNYTAVDSIGCLISGSLTIPQVGSGTNCAINPGVISTNVSNAGCNNGTIRVNRGSVAYQAFPHIELYDGANNLINTVNLPAGTSSHTFANLTPGHYVVKVSDNQCCELIFIRNIKCRAPSSGFNATNVTATSAQLNWNVVHCADGYRVKYRPQGTLTWLIKGVNTNIGFKNIAGLQPNTAYQWKVATKCPGWPTIDYLGYSGISTFTTGALREGEIQIVSTTQSFDISLYPNPATNMLTVYFESENVTASLNIMNSVGQVIVEKQLTVADGMYEDQIDVSKLNTGIYLLYVKSGKAISIKKFVKE